MTATKHPAKFHDTVLDAMRPHLQALGTPIMCDPFAGTGRAIELWDDGTVSGLVMIELEPEFAYPDAVVMPKDGCPDYELIMPHVAEGNWCSLVGDSISWLNQLHIDDFGGFDAIATSPTWGNRMADTYLPPETDKSKRYTYTVALGHELSEGSSAGLQWGPAYRGFHTRWLYACANALNPGGLLLIDIGDHQRGGERMHVTDWFGEMLRNGVTGLEWEGSETIEAPRNKHSPTRERPPQYLLRARRTNERIHP